MIQIIYMQEIGIIASTLVARQLKAIWWKQDENKQKNGFPVDRNSISFAKYNTIFDIRQHKQANKHDDENNNNYNTVPIEWLTAAILS